MGMNHVVPSCTRHHLQPRRGSSAHLLTPSGRRPLSPARHCRLQCTPRPPAPLLRPPDLPLAPLPPGDASHLRLVRGAALLERPWLGHPRRCCEFPCPPCHHSSTPLSAAQLIRWDPRWACLSAAEGNPCGHTAPVGTSGGVLAAAPNCRMCCVLWPPWRPRFPCAQHSQHA